MIKSQDKHMKDITEKHTAGQSKARGHLPIDMRWNQLEQAINMEF